MNHNRSNCFYQNILITTRDAQGYCMPTLKCQPFLEVVHSAVWHGSVRWVGRNICRRCELTEKIVGKVVVMAKKSKADAAK